MKQAEAEYERRADLASRQVASKQALDNATANRDSARARLKQAEVDTAQAVLSHLEDNIAAVAHHLRADVDKWGLRKGPGTSNLMQI